MRATILLATFAVLTAGHALAATGGDWVAYRDAYRAMVQFEKYGGPKSLLQQQLQVVPRMPGIDAHGVQLMVVDKTGEGHYPLDATLRTVFPLTRAAYDNNATLQLSPPLGAFTVRPQVSLALRPDNLYGSEELRQGCEQALAYVQQAALFGARRCVGVRFVFSKESVAAPLVLRGAGTARLDTRRGAPFAGDGDADFPVVTYRFGGAERIMLGTASVLLAITPVFD